MFRSFHFLAAMLVTSLGSYAHAAACPDLSGTYNVVMDGNPIEYAISQGACSTIEMNVTVSLKDGQKYQMKMTAQVDGVFRKADWASPGFLGLAAFSFEQDALVARETDFSASNPSESYSSRLTFQLKKDGDISYHADFYNLSGGLMGSRDYLFTRNKR